MSQIDRTTTLEARFDTAEDAARAVERLANAAVPTEQIDVYSLDRSGHRGPKVKVSEAPGVKRGAILGAAIGAGFGLIAFLVMAMTRSFGVVEVGTLTATHAAYYIGACAAAGVPLGAAIGMASTGKRRFDGSSATRDGPFVVAVRTDGRAEEARRALERTGARELR